jgi:hypothetical protein
MGPEREDSSNEVSTLLRTLIELGAYQNALLTDLSLKIDTTICILERISKQTCETLNEVHAQAGLREGSAECKEIHFPPPSSVCTHCGRVTAHPQECDHKPYCEYEPCQPAEEEGGSEESAGDSAEPQRTFGAPYPPAVRPEAPEREANDYPAPKVPRGPFRGFLEPGQALAPLNIQSDSGSGGNPDPVVFGTYTNYGKVAAPLSAIAADISGSESGSVVLATGNWYAAYSTDSGNSFTSVDPTTIFDNTADGGFCCDQIVQYAPSVDRFIWLMQFSTGSNGKNRLRIAAASPETVSSSNCTSWTYWDLTSDALGITTTAADATNGVHWLDYPNMSVGDNYLYVSADNVGNTGQQQGGRIVVRIPLSEIAAGSTINFRFTHWQDGANAYACHVAQNCGDTAYWAGNENNSTLQVFNWTESSTSYFWRSVGVNNWPNGTLTSTAENGVDWLTKANSFPLFGVIGATRVGNQVWFAWTASNGTGSNGGFNFPNANVQVVKIDPTNNYKLLDQFAIWNNDYAFAYPALATNDNGDVGIALAWGGRTFDANSAVGILGDFVVWYRESSTFSNSRWGDFVTARQASPNTSLFAGFGYAILKDTTVSAGYRFDPFYVLFGRQSIINPGSGQGLQ